MSAYRLTHVDDATLLHDLSTLAARDRATTAELLAEVDDRRLYVAAACSSMFAYCIRELRLSEDATYKRTQAARAARRYPRLFADLAAGRLHLTAVCLLAPHLTAENVDELVAAASGLRKAELEAWLAARFGAGAASVLRERVTVVAAPTATASTQATRETNAELALAQVASPIDAPVAPAPEPVEPAPAEVAPAPVRYVVQVPINEATHAKLRRAQALLAHAVPSGELAAVLDRALDALLERLEKCKGAAPVRAMRRVGADRPPPRARTIPARVRRAVWERDGGRCTFTGPGPGRRRCDTRRRLEFDHVIPFARGGTATVDGLRLRCRVHNQFEAERAFGSEFMRRKRAGSRASKPLLPGDFGGGPECSG